MRFSVRLYKPETHDDPCRVSAYVLPILAAPQQGPQAWGLHTLLI